MFERAQKQEKKARCRSTRRGALTAPSPFSFCFLRARLAGSKAAGRRRLVQSVDEAGGDVTEVSPTTGVVLEELRPEAVAEPATAERVPEPWADPLAEDGGASFGGGKGGRGGSQSYRSRTVYFPIARMDMADQR